MTPGGLLWMVRWEWRLSWRAFLGANQQAATRFGMVALGLVVLITAHLPALALLPAMQGKSGNDADFLLTLLDATLPVLIAVASLAASRAAIHSLIDQRGLALLLTSPVSHSVLLQSRLIRVLLAGGTTTGLVLLGFAHVGLVLGQPMLLWLYPSWLGISLLGSAIGVRLALLFIQRLGLQRAYWLAPWLGLVLWCGLGTCVALLLFIAGQFDLAERFDPEQVSRWTRVLGHVLAGEPIPSLIMLAIGVLAFWRVHQFALPRFATLIRTQPTASQPKVDEMIARFGTAPWLRGCKHEWRLIWRIAESRVVLLQPAMMSVIAVMMLRDPEMQDRFALIIGMMGFIAITTGAGLVQLRQQKDPIALLEYTAPRSLCHSYTLRISAMALFTAIAQAPFVLVLLIFKPALALGASVIFCVLSAVAVLASFNPMPAKQGKLAQPVRTGIRQTIRLLLLQASWGCLPLLLIGKYYALALLPLAVWLPARKLMQLEDNPYPCDTV